MIDFYSDINPGPNIRKIAIMLEECDIEYRRIDVDIYNKPSLSAEFLQLSPSGTVPMIVDRSALTPQVVFETGAILLYLSERAGRLLPRAERRRTEALQWLFWQTSQLGPVFFFLNHFANRAEEKSASAVRYFNESGAKLLRVLDSRLSDREYLADEYSVADIATYPWAADIVAALKPGGSEHVRRWLERIAVRSPVQLAMQQFPTRVT